MWRVHLTIAPQTITPPPPQRSLSKMQPWEKWCPCWQNTWRMKMSIWKSAVEPRFIGKDKRWRLPNISHPSYHHLLHIAVVQVGVDVSRFATDESSPGSNGGSGYFSCYPEHLPRWLMSMYWCCLADTTHCAPGWGWSLTISWGSTSVLQPKNFILLSFLNIQCQGSYKS